jgi:hypothetical protein
MRRIVLFVLTTGTVLLFAATAFADRWCDLGC